MVTILAFSVDHRRVVAWPRSSADLSAVRLIFGSGGLTAVAVTEALSRAVFLPRLATISNLVVPGAGVTLLPPILSTFSPLRVISLASLVSHLTVTASPAVTSFRETVSLAVGVAQAPNKTATRTIARPEIECLILRVIYPPFLICVVRYFKIKKRLRCRDHDGARPPPRVNWRCSLPSTCIIQISQR